MLGQSLHQLLTLHHLQNLHHREKDEVVELKVSHVSIDDDRPFLPVLRGCSNSTPVSLCIGGGGGGGKCAG